MAAKPQATTDDATPVKGDHEPPHVPTDPD